MQNTSIQPSAPWLMLFARSALFFVAQLALVGLFWLSGMQDAWMGSANWWPYMALFANIVTIFLLARLFRAEGCRYFDVLRFSKKTVKTDLLWLLGSSVIGMPIAAAPMNSLAAALYGDPQVPLQIMFHALPGWAVLLAFLFPLTIPFAELPTYFGYIMPRLAVQLKNGWAAWLISAFFLGFQHIFLPFVPDGRFLLWRLGMYMPFALFAGLMIKLRPSLLPYMAVIHGLIDISAVTVYWMI